MAVPKRTAGGATYRRESPAPLADFRPHAQSQPRPGTAPGRADLVLAPIAPTPAAQAEWSLTAQTTQPLTLTVETVRVAYLVS